MERGVDSRKIDMVPLLRSEGTSWQPGAIVEKSGNHPRPVIAHKTRKGHLGRRDQHRVARPDFFDLSRSRHEDMVVSRQFKPANFLTLCGQSIRMGKPNPHGARL